ncbi:DUF2471 domain-containing protein (plasmid) [Achromobacter xylosoxidans]|uniref:DUF2471 family protein n=1 Tax=Alcaligenes xylosoxydans xylosoxydans TaxID=85698 RepID=UPI000DD17B4C|nr:DUF2471 domain-containing protein [Achromobacter xylosoxidans]AXA80578.1 DUF2471 domain-containing protein [Achromobacter xylosoxidans]
MLDLQAAIARLTAILDQEALAAVTPFDRSRPITWRQLRDVEQLLLDGLEGRVASDLLQMVAASPKLGYPEDDSPADFGDSNVRPLTFTAILKAWKPVHH